MVRADRFRAALAEGRARRGRHRRLLADVLPHSLRVRARSTESGRIVITIAAIECWLLDRGSNR